MRDEQVGEASKRPPFSGRDKRIVTLGGGTGPFALLSTLKHYPCSTTAIVTMADSGGSSRRLMDEFGQLPFGDLRQALVALSRKGSLWRDVFAFRFPTGGAFAPTSQRTQHSTAHSIELLDLPDLVKTRTSTQTSTQREVSGHNLGNLIISALENMNDGDLLWALEDAQELLDTAGRVLPITLKRATLCAELSNGDILRGESTIDTRGERELDPLPNIERLFLQEDPVACEQALHAIRQADVIVMGPGDLYTSVLPNLLVRGVREAIAASRAKKVYVCNLMTKHGETDGFRASDFVREMRRYLGSQIDRVIMHSGSFPAHLREIYATKEQQPIMADVATVRALVSEVVVGEFLALQDDSLVRHDADSLIQAVFAAPNPSFDMAAEPEIYAPA